MIYVKNDHRSYFFNLSNWKEEVWKNQGFIGIRTRHFLLVQYAGVRAISIG